MRQPPMENQAPPPRCADLEEGGAAHLARFMELDLSLLWTDNMSEKRSVTKSERPALLPQDRLAQLIRRHHCDEIMNQMNERTRIVKIGDKDDQLIPAPTLREAGTTWWSRSANVWS